MTARFLPDSADVGRLKFTLSEPGDRPPAITTWAASGGTFELKTLADFDDLIGDLNAGRDMYAGALARWDAASAPLPQCRSCRAELPAGGDLCDGCLDASPPRDLRVPLGTGPMAGHAVDPFGKSLPLKREPCPRCVRTGAEWCQHGHCADCGADEVPVAAFNLSDYLICIDREACAGRRGLRDVLAEAVANDGRVRTTGPLSGDDLATAVAIEMPGDDGPLTDPYSGEPAGIHPMAAEWAARQAVHVLCCDDVPPGALHSHVHAPDCASALCHGCAPAASQDVPRLAVPDELAPGGPAAEPGHLEPARAQAAGKPGSTPGSAHGPALSEPLEPLPARDEAADDKAQADSVSLLARWGADPSEVTAAGDDDGATKSIAAINAAHDELDAEERQRTEALPAVADEGEQR